MGVNLIYDAGVEAMSTGLFNIPALDLHRCGITSNGIPHLVSALQDLPEPVKLPFAFAAQVDLISFYN